MIDEYDFPAAPPLRVTPDAVLGVEVAAPGAVVDFALLPDWKPLRARWRVVPTPRGLVLVPPDTTDAT